MAFNLFKSIARADTLRGRRQQTQGGRMIGELGGGPLAMLRPNALAPMNRGRARRANALAAPPSVLSQQPAGGDMASRYAAPPRSVMAGAAGVPSP